MRPVLAGLVMLLSLAGFTSEQPVDPAKPEDAPAAVERRAMMIGRWFSDTPTKDGGRIMQFVDRRSDGRMTIWFRTVDGAGLVDDQTEVAMWGISGSVYFTITVGWLHEGRLSRADPTSAYFYDAYEILELTEHAFRYRHVVTGNAWQVRRVGPDFAFPE